MKFFLCFLTLAVLAAVSNSASVLNGRANLIVGNVRPGDVLLQRRQLSIRARPNAIQYQDYVYRGYARTNITSVRAIENGRTQYANAFIIAGGIGRNNVTVRLQSARGYGFDYIIEIYGR